MVTAQPSSPQSMRFIDPITLMRISSLELIARTVVEGFVSGLHRSPHLGFSVNFAEYRPYRPGDDIRKIDWKVFARLDRYFVKEYEGETNTGLQIILDCSRSMAFSGQGIPKVTYGQYLAASLAYFAFKQRDSIGFVAFDHELREYVPARGSMGHLNTVLHAIERTEAGRETSFRKPLEGVGDRLRRRGIVIVISDLYDRAEHVMSGLRNLAYRGNDVIVFQLLDPLERNLDYQKSAQFVDMETREEMHVIPDYLREEYRKIMREQVTFYEKECQKDRMDYALLDTSQPLDTALAAYLLRREQLY
ncbi:MAG: DUF58 domain-containing protein [Acidobacteria bacterium]|nr:DUF58 domain-containing protein [Acidobacteriota bacterium]